MFFPTTIPQARAQLSGFPFKALPIDFDNAIAAGGNSGPVQVNSFAQGWFVATQAMGDIWTSAAGAGPPLFAAGQPVARWTDASPPATVGNQFPGRNQFEFQGSTNGEPWSQLPVNFGLSFGTADAPYVLPVPLIFPPNSAITATLYNRVTSLATFGVVAQVLLIGYLMPGPA